MQNSAEYLLAHNDGAGKLGVTGFCWGGSVTNDLASRLGDSVAAAAPFYGSGIDAEQAATVKAKLMIQSAEDDQRINAAWPDFEAALKGADVDYVRHIYPGTGHGFHNNSTPRYKEEAATLAWNRTVELFRAEL